MWVVGIVLLAYLPYDILHARSDDSFLIPDLL